MPDLCESCSAFITEETGEEDEELLYTIATVTPELLPDHFCERIVLDAEKVLCDCTTHTTEGIFARRGMKEMSEERLDIPRPIRW